MKITTKLKLKGMQAKLQESRRGLEKIKDYQNMGYNCTDLSTLYLDDFKRFKDALAQFRNDIVFLKVNKTVRYSKIK